MATTVHLLGVKQSYNTGKQVEFFRNPKSRKLEIY